MTLLFENTEAQTEHYEGVDRKELKHIKQKFLVLNQTRYTRTLTALSERQQQFLVLLPLLFHVNHPLLPGYIGHQTPAGIHGYIPSKDEIRAAKIITRSFTYQRDLIDKNDAIEALYIMGSLGTIAHNESSDIDVWVCHKDLLSAQSLAELHEKCQALSRWAADVIHIETHFFLMNAKKFSHGQQAILTNEASGSAQHYLLLDEFYRTAVWLAGKLPLWWFVPAEHERNYEGYSKNLLDKRFLRASDLIDFGGLPAIPPTEFIGAGIWQLYKGIDSPYKSVLKLLLLEAYTDENFCEPLSLGLKRKVYETVPDADSLDAYVLVYKRLEDYLRAKNQLTRLELVRRCLYFKAGRSLSHTSRASAKSWQRLLLEKIVKEWGWEHHQLTILDNRAYWKTPHVMVERNLLANELNQGYRLLMDMNKSNFSNVSISGDELLILGRKLHAAFERKAGKIDWINPNISQDLSEPELCFVQTQDEGEPLWQVYRGSQQDFSLRTQVAEPIKRSRHFIELLLWCYGNGILAFGTRLDIVSKRFLMHNSQRQQLLQVLQNWMPLPQKKPSHEVFTQNAKPEQMLLLFNIGVEPQAELHKKGMQMLSTQRDAFGYSGFKENLVLSVDLIQSNSWGEISCRHFSADALMNCLLYYLRAVPPDSRRALPGLTIRCFSLGQGATIEQRVTELWQAVINCFYGVNKQRNPRFIFEMAEEYFLLQFVQQQAQILRYRTYEKLLEKLSQPQAEFSPIVIDAFALRDKSLRIFSENATSSAVYLFYQIENKRAHVTIVDYNGAVFSKTFTLFNVQTLLRPLYRFIRSAIERQSLEQDGPQEIHEVIDKLQSINIYELLGEVKHKNAHLEPRSIGNDLSQLHFINICAVAEPGYDNKLNFTIFCDGKEFSVLEYGAELFIAVARHILSLRKSGEIYPFYITELDLSLCRDFIAPQTGIQLIHYLHIKSDLEEQLNAALQKL